MSGARYVKMIVETLATRGERIVLAESCTGGLVTATLAKVPGVSEHLCGGMVTYRDATKEAWLDVPGRTLARHSAVSEATAKAMVRGVLRATPEATWGVSVTGHLGPHAPTSLDGLVFVALARRRSARRIEYLGCERYRLQATSRLKRRDEAVTLVLDLIAEVLDAAGRGTHQGRPR